MKIIIFSKMIIFKLMIILKKRLSKFYFFLFFCSLSEFNKCKEIIFKIRLSESEYKNLMKEKNKKNGIKSKK